VFSAHNIKSKDLYLPVIAKCKWRMRSDT